MPVRKIPKEPVYTEADVDRIIERVAAYYERKIAAAEQKRSRGRPPKMTLAKFSGIKSKPKKGGRPARQSKADMIESIEVLERLKAILAAEKGVPTISDKATIEYYVEKFEARAANDPHLSDRRKRDAVIAWRKQIKYCRDQTGIRTRRHQKRKTS